MVMAAPLFEVTRWVRKRRLNASARGPFARVLPVALAAAGVLIGCGGHATSQSTANGGSDGSSGPPDGNVQDASVPEASMSDASLPDATTAEASIPDANVDASTVDARMSDAAVDAISPDSAAADAGADASTAIVFSCPGCPSFPPPGATACAAATLGPAILAYPLDGTLFPPNLGGYVEVHFAPPAGATLFEVDFENAISDVRVEAQCNGITPVRGGASAGCGVTLTTAE